MHATQTLPVLGDYDYRRLKLLLKALRLSRGRHQGSAETLRAKLERAVVVPTTEVPADVVTLYSTVRYRNLTSRNEHSLTIVFPGETRDRDDCVSVLAPVGLALLGERLSATVECATPEGKARLRVMKVLYQPEAAGAYYV
jgi:regulator of nucleoside diphosphate kinase